MPKRHRHLIDRIVTIENLRDAYRKTAKNKRMTWGYLEFKEYAEANLLLIQQELADAVTTGSVKIRISQAFDNLVGSACQFANVAIFR
jgi:hypothetical protein